MIIPPTEIILQRPYEAQQVLIRNKKRNNLLILSRRWGKTTLSKILVALDSLQTPNFRVGWFAPTYKTLQEVFEQFIVTLKPLTVRLSREEKRLVLVNGAVIEFWSSQNISNGRGRAYHRIVVDEAQDQNKLEDFVYGTLRPCLADYEGELWILGTANGEGSELHRFYMKCKEDKQAWFLAHGSLDQNPYIKKTEIAQMRREMGPRAAQELDAQWIPTTGTSPLIGWFEWDDLEEEIDYERPMKMLALDASLTRDSTALVASWRHPESNQYYVDYNDTKIFLPTLKVGEKLEIDYEDVEQYILRIWESRQFSCIVYDKYQVAAMAQRLRRKGVRAVEFDQNALRLQADTYLRQVMNDNKLHHSGNSELSEHVRNAVISYNKQQTRLRIVKPNLMKRIDAAIALSMSVYALGFMKPSMAVSEAPAAAAAIPYAPQMPSQAYSPVSGSDRYNPFKK